MNNKIILFSGRYDRFHVGHLITIARLGQSFDKVIVCILDYEGQYFPLQERLKTIKDALQYVRGNYQVITNEINFEHITREEVEKLPKFTHYGTGNYQCYRNMASLGYEVVDVKRYPGYTASDDRKFQRFVKFLEDEGYIR